MTIIRPKIAKIKPGFSTLTKNVPECTGKNVPVFPVHFPKIIPKFKTVTRTHGLSVVGPNLTSLFYKKYAKYQHIIRWLK